MASGGTASARDGTANKDTSPRASAEDVKVTLAPPPSEASKGGSADAAQPSVTTAASATPPTAMPPAAPSPGAASGTAVPEASEAPVAVAGSAEAACGYSTNYSDVSGMPAPAPGAPASPPTSEAPQPNAAAPTPSPMPVPAPPSVGSESATTEPPAAPPTEPPTVTASAAGGDEGGGEAAVEPPLPDGWESVVDESGRQYFWNVHSDEVVWSRPTAPSAAAAASGAADVDVDEAVAPPPPAAASAAPAVASAASPTASPAASPRVSRSSTADEGLPSPAGSVRAKAGLFAGAADGAAPAAATSSPAGLVEARAKKFTPAAEGGGGGGGGAAAAARPGAGGVADTLKALHKAGVSDRTDAAAGGGAQKPTQHRVAIAALERKAERANATKTSSSQHAAALRGLQQAEQASVARSFKPGASPFKGASTSAGSSVSASPAGMAGSPMGVVKAKQAFAAKVDGESSAKQGSQMEEALRKLHGKGVVPTKLAFGTQSKEGTQHADAMKAFMGKEVRLRCGTNRRRAAQCPLSVRHDLGRVLRLLRCVLSIVPANGLTFMRAPPLVGTGCQCLYRVR